jgi:hypothetical protein
MTIAKIRSTAGFRNLQLFELNSSYYPIGALTLEPSIPYTTSGSVISGSVASVAAGVAVSGSIPYYGIKHSGAKVLTINDPIPRIIPHIGDDGVFSVQVLPATEVMSGELQMDKTNDIVDVILSGGVKSVSIGESNVFLQSTNKRGYEYQVGAIAFSAAQDTDPNSATFGATLWDWRMYPKTLVFLRESGYQAEANLRPYSFTPMFCTAYLWGTAFTEATEGATRSQLIRGVSQGKPTMVSFLGDGATTAFPFDSAQPALSAAKVTVWVDGVLKTTGISASVRGVSFAAAPAASSVIVVFYEQ